MISCNILFDKDMHAVSRNEITQLIIEFGDSYTDATSKIIRDSQTLDEKGEVFIKCASLILSKFGMTRRGIFSINPIVKLQACWDKIAKDLLKIKNQINNSGKSRDRYLLEITEYEFTTITSDIWTMTKDLLPITMSSSSYGLVGASKILFSVLPEIVLPVDNQQWRELFKTVDLGDLIHFMAHDIYQWEYATGEKLNLIDPSGRLSTLPAVYNVVAMAARPSNKK